MRNTTNNINLSINFNQLVELVRQLSFKEKVRLGEVIRKETESNSIADKVFTHLASEPSLSKDWNSIEEDESWKNL